MGKGCGQTSRIDALRHAVEKAKQFNFDLTGAVMASDAFFPFSDCVQLGHDFRWFGTIPVLFRRSLPQGLFLSVSALSEVLLYGVDCVSALCCPHVHVSWQIVDAKRILLLKTCPR